MHSHHSHSLDYIAHGVDGLEAVVARAVDLRFELFCMTEHMPRIDAKYLYPEEVTSTPSADLKTLQEKFEKFLKHASQIKQRGYATKFIIGVEVEGCDADHIAYAKSLMEENKNVLQFCVGSIHHINGIPIDFDQAEWNRALTFTNDNLKSLALDYFEQQYKLITEMKPLVVGHFDLFRLFCSKDLFIDPASGLRVEPNTPGAVCAAEVSFPELWAEVRASAIRNLEFIASYGGILEINTSGLRKGLRDPYPSRDFAILAKSIPGTRFALSDDAHGVAHVGVCYEEALSYIENVLELDELHFLQDLNGNLTISSINVQELKKHPFWDRYKKVHSRDKMK